MFSVIVYIDTDSASACLRQAAQTLASLVPLAVEGLVRDVALVCVQPREGLRRLSEESGADLFEMAQPAILAMKADNGLILQAGPGLDHGLAEEICTFLLGADGHRGAVLHTAGRNALISWLRPKTGGVVAPKSELLRAGSVQPEKIKRHLAAPLVLKGKLSSPPF